MAKKYYWLKLKEDFFNQKEIKKLRKIAGGDTYTIIYLKMQLLSLKNEAKLIFEGTEDTMSEQLALEIDEDVENIEVVLRFLDVNNLVEVCENEYFLTKANECIGGEGDSAERVRKYRERKALQCNVTALPSNNNVTASNTEIEIENKRKKIEIDYKHIVEYLNEKAGTSYKYTTQSTKDKIQARANEGFIVADFEKVIDIKVADWGKKQDMKKYLRPETLFGTKFESYLNQNVVVENVEDERWKVLNEL